MPCRVPCGACQAPGSPRSGPTPRYVEIVRPDQSRETVRVLRAIQERRDYGRVHVAVYELEAGDVVDPGAIMEAVGLEPVAEVELTLDDARLATTEVLARDLAYRATIMPNEDAEALAASFLRLFPAPASYWTNGELLVAHAHGTSGAWRSATEATFDSGLVVVSATRAGILWVEDED